ncbi:MAG: 50S ribosomal protein L19 [candidate division WOR-3 bacterium]
MKLNFKPGDIVRVHTKYREIERDKEKGKEEVRERTQVFEGVVLKIKGEGESKTFTVRRVSRGIGIERIFFLSSPLLLKVEVKKRGKVRRAKLYYLREKKGKAGKIKSEEVVLSQPAEVKGEGEKKEG